MRTSPPPEISNVAFAIARNLAAPRPSRLHRRILAAGWWYACDRAECPPNEQCRFDPYCDGCMVALYAAARRFAGQAVAVVAPTLGREIKQGLMATFEQCQHDRVAAGLDAIQIPCLT